MIKEVLRAGSKVGHVEHPSGKGDGQTKLVLLVTLAAQWQEAETLQGRLVE